MAEQKVAVEEQVIPDSMPDFALPQDPVLRDLALQKLNSKEGLARVPVLVEKTTPANNERTAAIITGLEGLLGRFMRFLMETDTPQRTKRRRTRGWSD